MSIGFDRSKKTFLGFLQARGKSIHTIRNYDCDLREFGAFCDRYSLDFQKLSLKDFEEFHKNLQERGLRSNSRRRKLMTVKFFLRYLSGRMDLSLVGVEKLIPPEKVEKPPKLPSLAELKDLYKIQPSTPIGTRNKVLIQLLLETGMLVSEALLLQKRDITFLTQRAALSVSGKRARTLTVSSHCSKLLKRLIAETPKGVFLFYGYTKAGPNAEKLTSRGVEILFKAWSTQLGIYPSIHPRTLRHVFVIQKLALGTSEKDIMIALGLKTPYAFRVYQELFKRVQKSNLIASFEKVSTL